MATIHVHNHYHTDGDSGPGKKQKKFSLGMFIFETLLASVWVTLAVLTLMHVSWATHLAQQVLWVTLISYYANAFTNIGGAMGAFSAFVSGSNEDHSQEAVVTKNSSK